MRDVIHNKKINKIAVVGKSNDAVQDESRCGYSTVSLLFENRWAWPLFFVSSSEGHGYGLCTCQF